MSTGFWFLFFFFFWWAGANRSFLPRGWWILIILDLLWGFFRNSAQWMGPKEVHGNYINCFSKKSLVWVKRTTLVKKVARLPNSRFTLRIVFKFCIMKGAKRHTKVISMVFCEKKILFVTLGLLKGFVIHFVQWKGTWKLLMVFSKKIIWGNQVVLSLKMARPVTLGLSNKMQY